jgi:phosphatidylglycerol---prolipoprotein diacylglyceryl transferase
MSWPFNPHAIFEALAYFVGFRVYLAQRRRFGDPVGESTRWSVIVGAAVGAMLGSKVLFLLEDPSLTMAHWSNPAFLLGGKTIVGGLTGGLIGVELTKVFIGERRSTGDLFVLPLIVGMSIGRVGCFLAGLPDHTYGVASSLPWAVDFGDGVRRHPTQLYEIVFLVLLATSLHISRNAFSVNGDRFKAFIAAYMCWRLAVSFIQPEPRFAGLSSIQWVCAATLVYYAVLIAMQARQRRAIAASA